MSSPDIDPRTTDWAAGGGHDAHRARGALGWIGALWGVGGIIWMLVAAIARLAQIGIQASSHPLGPLHLAFATAWILFMAWSEGYRGFHRSFSPMVAARARYLRDHPNGLHVVFAPLFCFGFIHATQRRKIRSWGLAIGIVILVVLVRLFVAQPWRGIVDLGVVVGLSIGVASMLYYALAALRAESFDVSPEVDE
ncbi:MAG: hypothetical protein MJB57_06860 [Gemmatimonadetes bacterium]|nr:hypothetical protein [Gemmatimonadota bacterium]